MNRRRSQKSDEAQADWARSVLAAAARQPGSEGTGPAGDDRPDTWRGTWPESWDALELPPAPAVPADFARRVARAAAAERERACAPILGARWMRAAAAAALLAGIALGGTLALQSGFGAGLDTLPSVDSIAAWGGALEEDSWTETLSEEYLVALAADESALPAAADGPAEVSE